MHDDEFNVHAFEYEMDGSKWSMTVPARSVADARARLRKAAGGAFVGDHVTEIPAVPGAGLWVRLLTWWRNLAR